MENKYISIVKNLKLTDYKKIAVSILALLILLVVCNLMLKGVGTSHSERNIFLFVIFIVILDSSKKSFYYIALPICILHAIYSPVGFMFGPPSYSYVASVFATNIAETREFFNAIPIKNYIYSIFIIVGILFYRHLTSKFNIRFYRNKTLLIVFIIFAMLKQAPFIYINNLSASYEEVKNELETLNELTVADQWGKTTLKNSKYDTYVLIIGESARKDYHHAFGYPINDTPFMSNAKGILVDGLKSGGTGTIASLRLMLTKGDNKTWQPNYGLNFVDLAKDAGIETYWLSNQGYIGIYDTPVSAIAQKSDHTYFTKYGDWDTKNTSDFLLLNHIRNIVNQHDKKKKLIVVHLLGSHPNACDRIFDYKKIMKHTNKEFSYLNCYISSIKKTDEFIKKTYDILNTKYKEKHSTFSLIYFSDHGMVHQKVNDIIYMNNSTISKFHYDIPLFNIASDSKERKFCKSFKSGLNFTNGIGNWLGIINSNLDGKYDLFDCISDKNDYGLFKKIDDILSPPDYAVNISQ